MARLRSLNTFVRGLIFTKLISRALTTVITGSLEVALARFLRPFAVFTTWAFGSKLSRCLFQEYSITANGCCPSCGTQVPGRWAERFEGQITDRPFVTGYRRDFVTIE